MRAGSRIRIRVVATGRILGLAFEGVGRRIELKGEINGVTVLDDYGHHPTEIKATLAAVQGRWPNRRLVVLFQPHRYSRTRDLFDRMGL